MYVGKKNEMKLLNEKELTVNDLRSRNEPRYADASVPSHVRVAGLRGTDDAFARTKSRFFG